MTRGLESAGSHDGVPGDSLAQSTLTTLLGAVAGGDAEALGELYDATFDLVLCAADRILRNPQEAEEAAVDVYQHVWRRASLYDESRGSVRSWLMTIARGRSLDRVRAIASRRQREQTLSTTASSSGIFDEASPDVSLIAAEHDDALERALRALPKRQRTLIEAAFLHNMSHSRISSEFGESLGTVKSLIRRGLIKLHDRLTALEKER